MNIEVFETPAGRSLHGTDEVWVQVTTNQQDTLLDWPTVKQRVKTLRPDLALPVHPKAYYPALSPEGDTSEILPDGHHEEWWVVEKKLEPNTDEWGIL